MFTLTVWHMMGTPPTDPGEPTFRILSLLNRTVQILLECYSVHLQANYVCELGSSDTVDCKLLTALERLLRLG